MMRPYGWQVIHYGVGGSVTGATEDLAYVSPRTGRAVSRAAAGPYKEKLLPLPGFLSTGGLPSAGGANESERV